MARPFIRSFEPRDKDEMVVIVRPYLTTSQSRNQLTSAIKFNETADPVLASKGEEALRIGAHTYCIPYFILQPENCFVVDDGNGRAVGYIIGTPDNRNFVKQWREKYIPLLQDQGISKPDLNDSDSLSEMRLNAHSPEEKLLEPPVRELLKEFLGHLHIDIRPEWQRQGLGVQLMDAFLNHVKQQGCKGVHLGMLAANEGAEKFYQRLGFGRFPHVLDGGKSGEEGRDGHVVYMVKTLVDVAFE